MKRALSALALLCQVFLASAQTTTTVFTDDFNRTSLSPGGTPTETYNTNISTGATIAPSFVSGSNYMINITSGSATGAAQTKNLFVGGLDIFDVPFSTPLNAMPGIVTWTFNMRTNTAATGLPAQSVLGGGVDLCGDAGANILSGAPTGYGVVFNSGTTGGVSLVRFSGGLTSSTIIITQTTTVSKTNYYSVRVTYDPTTNNWSLYVRDDGASGFADPSTGVTLQQGSTVSNSTYTGQNMTNWGVVYTNPNGTAGKVMSFDNFKVTVTLPACTGTPSPGNTIASLSTVCSGNTTALSLQNFSSGSVTYDWKSAPNVSGSPGTFTSTGVTSASYTPTMTATKWYKCDVTCSGSTGTSNPVLVTVANCGEMTKNATLSSTICGSYILYDAGGVSGNYTNNETNIYTIYPSAGSSGAKVTCTYISFDTEPNYDSISIFDGNSVSAPRLVKYTSTGTATPGITSTAADGSLTFLFRSDVSNVGNGFSATLNTTNPNPITAHPVASTTVCSGITVNLSVASTGTNTYQWYNNGSTNSNTGGTLIPGATNASFAPSTASGGITYYYCVVANQCGATFPSSASAVIVNARPVITSVTAGPTPMCIGSELTLSGVGASSASGLITYNWNGPNWYSNTTTDAVHSFYVYEPEASGVYSLSVTDPISGCSSAVMSSNTIVVRDLSSVVLNISPSTLCAGGVMTLTATDMTGVGTPIGFTWMGPGGYNTTTTTSTQTYVVPSAAASGTYYLMVTFPGEGCISYLGSAVATVNEAPDVSNISSSTSNSCSGGTSTVTVNSTSLGTGTFSVTYDLSGANSSSGNVASLTISGTSGSFMIPSSLLSAGGATSVTVTSIANASGCSATLSSGNSASFNINPSPTATSVTNSGLNCGSATMLASNGGNGTIYYQGTTPGGLDISTPSSSQTVTASGTYYFRARSVAGCWGQEGSVAVTINSAPTSVNVTGGGAHCTSTTIVADNGGDGTIYFQSATSGGTSTAVATSSQVISSSGTYYFRARSAAGCWGAEGSAVVTIGNVPATVVINGGGTFCESATITAANGSDGTMYFQGTTSGGTSIAAPSSSEIITSSGTYYFRALSADGCWGPEGSVAVTVNARPADVMVSGAGTFCGATTITAGNGADGTIYFQGATSGATATTTVSGSEMITSSGTYYFRAQSAQGCWSNEGSAAVTIDQTPNITTVSGGGPFCESATIVATNGNDGTMYFQGTASGGTSITAPSLTETITSSGTYYFRARSAGGCWGSEGSVDVTINPRPADVIVNGAGTFCGAATITAGNGSDGTIYFQGAAAGGTSIASASASEAITTSGTYYFRAQSAQGCWSNEGSAAVTINHVPDATSASGGGVFCDAATLIATNGNDGMMYFQGATSGGTSTATLSSSETITSSGTYYFRAQSADGCWGTEGSVAVTVNPRPAEVIVTGAGTFCGNSTITADNGGDGTIYYQGTTASGTSIASAVASEVITVSGTYYFRAQSAQGCWSNEGSAAVIINHVPDATSVSGGGVFCDAATITATNGNDGAMYFQGTTSGGASLSTPSSSEAITSSGTYYFRAQSSDGCWGAESSVAVTINTRPADITVDGTGTFCGHTNITADNGSDGIIYFQGTAGGGTSTISASASEVITTSGTYYFRAQSADGCWSNEGSTAVTINHVPDVITVSGGGGFCDVATITAGNGGDGTIYYQGLISGGTDITVPSISEVISDTGIYFFRAQSAEGCWGAEGSVSVTVNPLPAIQTASGGGAYCDGGSGSPIRIGGSDMGIDYQLYNGSVAIDAPVSGTNSSIIFGTYTTAGTYTVLATDVTSGCTQTMAGAPAITINPLPSVHTVTGTGSYCAGGAGLAVGLDGSDNDVDYNLYDGSTSIGSAHGNTLPVSFGAQTTAATYTVIATDAVTGCSSNMAGSAVVVIDPLLVPAVNIVTSTPSICAGTTVSFTTTEVNGGTAPAYQWYIGSVPVAGATTAVFSSSSLVDEDSVSVKLHSNATCATPIFATDNVTMTVIAGEMPAVSIVSTSGNTVCDNTVVNFTTTTAFGGATPGYIWYRNGANVGAGSTYSYIPSNGDVIYCKLLSDLMCRLDDTVSSNNITMVVNPTYIPLISLNVSPGAYIMAGQSDTIRAIVVNGGASPIYQWSVNTKLITGATSSVYVSDSFANNDSVTCVVISDGPCGVGSFNSIIIQVKATGVTTPFVNISDIRLMPNPSNGGFTIRGSIATDENQGGAVEVIDMIGNIVYRKPINIQRGKIEEQVRLDPSLANGIYMVNVKCAEDQKVLRVMIAR